MRKPRTNYEALIGQVINDVLVVDTKPVPKVSRTGREYKVRRLWVTKDNEHILEIGTQSWHKKSFMKRLDKITIEKPVEVKEQPRYEIELTSVMWRTKGKRTTEVERAINDMANIDSIPELKKYFNTECKKFHPDHGGNAKDFEEVRFWYEEELRNIESIQTALDEILNESVVKPVDELHDLKTTYNLKDLKNAYKTLARRYHPDNLETGDSDRFKLVKTIYDVRKLIIEEILEVFGYDDPNFAELVDMTEDLHKSMHKIVY